MFRFEVVNASGNRPCLTNQPSPAKLPSKCRSKPERNTRSARAVFRKGSRSATVGTKARRLFPTCSRPRKTKTPICVPANTPAMNHAATAITRISTELASSSLYRRNRKGLSQSLRRALLSSLRVFSDLCVPFFSNRKSRLRCLRDF